MRTDLQLKRFILLKFNVQFDGTHMYVYISVPFRDSVLTKLLKNALGGNSKTVMVSLYI